MLTPSGIYLPTQPFVPGATQVKVVDKTRWLSAGTYRIELLDSGGVVIGTGNYVVAAAATLTGSFTGPRTWSWTETVAAAAMARVLEPDADVIPGVSNIGAKTFVADVSYTPAAGAYTLQLRNNNFVIINEDGVTVP